MNMSGNHILITGGATGIGFSMAKYFHEQGNNILICGRRADRLEQAAKALPGILTFRCDVTDSDDRTALFAFVQEHFPQLNILINNAGVQRDIDLTLGTADFDRGENEIRVNLEAPIFLSALFIPMLTGQENAVIVNVSSGLAFMAESAFGMPVYCAAKAGLHAFSQSQRKQLAAVGIKVIEIIPPAVTSELNREGRAKRNRGTASNMMSSDDFVQQALAQMEEGADEIRVGRR